MASYAEQIEACYAERAAQPEQLLTLDAMIALSGMNDCIPAALPTAPRRLDSATHRHQVVAPHIETVERNPMKPEAAPMEDHFGRPLDERQIERHQEDERKRITDEGRKLPHMKGWGTATTPEEAARADRQMKARKAHGIYYGQDY